MTERCSEPAIEAEISRLNVFLLAQRVKLAYAKRRLRQHIRAVEVAFHVEACETASSDGKPSATPRWPAATADASSRALQSLASGLPRPTQLPTSRAAEETAATRLADRADESESAGGPKRCS